MPEKYPKGGVKSVADYVKKQLEAVDFIVAYLPAETLSMGVVTETMIGRALGKPVVVVTPESLRKKLEPLFQPDQTVHSSKTFVKEVQSIRLYKSLLDRRNYEIILALVRALLVTISSISRIRLETLIGSSS